MSLTPKEAAIHLNEAETAVRRSAQAYGYAKSSPHLILWGVIWIVGYLSTAILPRAANGIWFVLILVGMSASFYIGRSVSGESRSGAPQRWAWGAMAKSLALVVSIMVFIAAVYAIFGPPSGMQMAAFPSLLVGQVYICIGLFGLGVRIAVTGAAIFALTLFGYFLLAPYFLVWMAFVGGGALILGGLWLRQV